MKKKIILILCVCVLAFSLFQLGRIFFNYWQIEEDTKSLIENYTFTDGKAVTDYYEEMMAPLKRKIDFDGLKKKNSDVVGWISIPDTKVDEPILKGKTNETYLKTSIDHKKSSAGQVYMDKNNSKDFKDSNTILYGHNMKNGTRFHDLRYYIEKKFFEEHPKVYIYLPNNTVNVYEVFSSGDISELSKLYDHKASYSKLVSEASKVGKMKIDVPKEKSPILMLSTCLSSGDDSLRRIVFARLINNQKIEA